MKESKYNLLFPYEENPDSIIAYNTRTNALSLLDKEHYDTFLNFVKYGKDINDEDFKMKLLDSGYLIEDKIDELTLLRYNMLKDRFNTHILSLTIAPTMNCNFRCSYCYEKESLQNKYMSKEIQKSIFKFVEGWADSIHLLSINWYGGEPLLAMDIIRDLSEKFITLCKEKDIEYNASMVTNGYCLTPKIAKELNNLKVSSVQITIDGPEEIHNSRRPHVNGKGTFQKIVENMKGSVDYLKNITIRINTDNENENRIDEVFKVLKENNLSDKVRVYLGFVQSTNDYGSEKCMSSEIFSKRYYNFIKDNGMNFLNTYPKLITCFCGADAINSYVIDPEGNMCKCWEDIGKQEEVLFNIMDYPKIDINSVSKSFDYVMFDATVDAECSKCQCLPICMGGCPNKRKLDKITCTDKKYSLEQYLKEYANNVINKRKQKKQAEA